MSAGLRDRVAELEGEVGAIVKGLVDGFIERGECDLVQDFAAQVSVRVALTVAGLPLELASEASGWVNGIFHRQTGHRGTTEVGQKAMRDMFFTILDQVKAARKDPERAKGLIKTTLETDVGGDKLDDFRIASLCSRSWVRRSGR